MRHVDGAQAMHNAHAGVSNTGVRDASTYSSEAEPLCKTSFRDYNTIKRLDSHRITVPTRSGHNLSALLHWHEPGTSKAEKWLVFKLDIFILTYTCLSFFVKYLEQHSISNAYVTGMSDELHLNHDELNYFNTYFNIGVIIGAPLLTPVMTLLPPAYWLSACTGASSVIVLSMYRATDVDTLYGLRFALGFFSSTVVAGSYYLIGSWYKASEIYRRMAILIASSYAGNMFAGYIQAGLHASMEGKNGLAAWRWLFILDAVLGLPVAIYGVLCCPNEPHSKEPWWMSQDERQLAIDRLASEGRDAKGTFDWSVIRRVLARWQFYLFAIANGLEEATCSNSMTKWLTLYLKSKDFPAGQVNTIPTSIGGVEIVATILASILTDWSQRPALVLLAFGSCQLYSYIVLAAWPASHSAWLISTYMVGPIGRSAFGAIINGWANASCGGDRQLRVFTTALITSFGYACEVPAQLYLFPVSEAPSFNGTNGYAWGLGWTIAALLFASMAIPLAYRYFEAPQEAIPVERHYSDCEEAPHADPSKQGYSNVRPVSSQT